MADPQAVREAWIELGHKLAAKRKAAKLSQVELASRTAYSRSSVANVETGLQQINRTFWEAIDGLLGADGDLLRGYDAAKSLQRERQRPAIEDSGSGREGEGEGEGEGEPASAPLGFLSNPLVTSLMAPLQPPTSAGVWPNSTFASAGPHSAAPLAVGGGEIGGAALTGAAAYAGTVERMIYTALDTRTFARNSGASAVPDTDIAELLTEIADLARAYGSQPPGAVGVRALHLHDRARGWLDNTRRPTQQTDLYLALAQCSALLTSATSDLGLWTTAEQYAGAAYDYGDSIGHAGVRAYALGLQAMIAYWTGRAAEAVDFGLRAVEAAPAGMATVRAQSLLARAWGHRGAPGQVDLALRAAWAAWEDEGSDEMHDPAGGEFSWTRPQHERSASTAWLQVGRPDEASVAATQALHLIRSRAGNAGGALEAEARADLAACLILRGQPDAAQEALAPAVEVLSPLWNTPADWRRAGMVSRMERIPVLLADSRWRGVSQAQELRELTRAFLATRPTVPAVLA
ncbi:helix-turn-helix domain-containing protein [Actinoplanes sp. CA-030573]|uniref:helix-turn-helix domain-containing protein n=1 Tax=Actinoplanes sp. CA-030573 TaxID=3239898 RepID=UPI003D92FA81